MSQHYHQAGDQPEISLAAYTYNELGQLHKKILHENGGPVPETVTNNSALGTGQTLNLVASSSITLSDGFHVPEGATFTARIQSGGSGPGLGSPKQQYMAYTYNERGWLKSINDPDNVTDSTAFGMKLYYNDGTLAQYNGNISRMDWQTRIPEEMTMLTQEKQSFEYSYDKLNRLTLADYVTSSNPHKFNELLEYDVMGNITTLKRANATSGYMHDLTYNYTSNGESGNQLWGITDDAVGGGISSAYTYDANGNMRTDSRKDITIDYNQLNLPQTVSNSNETLSYTYDASGRKLKKSLGIDIRDYADGIEYNNGTIEFIQTAEGRIIPGDGSSYTYEYMLKDHLGNIRAAVKQDGSIVQVQDYYAFGLPFNANNQLTPSPDNQYKYNGKEWNTELSLNAYDYGARFLDPETGRWNVVDAKAEEMKRFSPYSYGFNNPMRFIDPDGMKPSDWVMGADNKPKWDASVTSADDEDLRGRTYIGRSAEYRATNGRDVQLHDGGTWSYTNQTAWQVPDGDGVESKTSKSLTHGSVDPKTLDMIDNLSTGIGINMATKETMFELAERTGSLGKTGERLLSFTKFMGRATGVTSMGVAWYEYSQQPTTSGLIKALTNTGLAFGRVNPAVGLTVGILDVTGVSDLIYNRAGATIDHYNKK